jgi:nucleoside-diphosphate-sugar epimerase
MAGRNFQMTKGLQVRDFIEVEEVAREILLSTTSQTEVGIIIRNIGSGNPRSLIDFAHEWWRRFGATGELIPGVIPDRPNEVMRYAACLKPVHY